jgi:hypothetical protein
MVRTQILLTEHQHRVLRDLSGKTGESLSALVRQAVDKLLAERDAAPSDRALALLGRFVADRTDVAENHDHYLWGEGDE